MVSPTAETLPLHDQATVVVLFLKVWPGLDCSKSFSYYFQNEFRIFNRSGKARVDPKAFQVGSV